MKPDPKGKKNGKLDSESASDYKKPGKQGRSSLSNASLDLNEGYQESFSLSEARQVHMKRVIDRGFLGFF